MESGDGDLVLRARGLPWSATESDVIEFFKGCEAGIASVHFLQTREGRATGEVFMVFTDNDSYQMALQKNMNTMGHRYIEIFESSRSELDWAVGRQVATAEAMAHDGVVRVRGLPFHARTFHLRQFFHGLEIVNVVQCKEQLTGRPSGEAFVQFASPAVARLALQRNLQYLDDRYVEVFPSSVQEMSWTTSWGARDMQTTNGWQSPAPTPLMAAPVLRPLQGQ